MTERITSLDPNVPLVQPQERANVFIGDTMEIDRRENAYDFAADFADVNKPLARTAVLIPVAAHQDADRIFYALSQYAEQRGCEPFTVLLNINAPSESVEGNTFMNAFSEVEKAKQFFPELDVRYMATEYSAPTIGAIRQNLWDSAFVLANHEGLFSSGTKDVIGINNDIDTEAISPHYIARIQKYYRTRQAKQASIGAAHAILQPAGTRVTHAVLDSHPNVGKVTTWLDNTSFQSPDRIPYEAGVVFPFSFYARYGGFNAQAQTHETSWASQGHTIPMITGAQLYTSPRRFIDRLEENGVENIWTIDSFGSDDTCRDTLRADITSRQAEDIILKELDPDLESHWLARAIKPMAEHFAYSPLRTARDEEVQNEVRADTQILVGKQINKATRLLRHVIGSDMLAAIVSESYDAHAYTNEKFLGMLARLEDTRPGFIVR